MPAGARYKKSCPRCVASFLGPQMCVDACSKYDAVKVLRIGLIQDQGENLVWECRKCCHGVTLLDKEVPATIEALC